MKTDNFLFYELRIRFPKHDQRNENPPCSNACISVRLPVEGEGRIYAAPIFLVEGYDIDLIDIIYMTLVFKNICLLT